MDIDLTIIRFLINLYFNMMEKIERDHYGWDITVEGKKFFDRFWVAYTPNMNYIFNSIGDEIYPRIAMNYAKQNNLSIELNKDKIESWTDKAISVFIEDISTIRIKYYIDVPFSILTTLENRLDFAMDLARTRIAKDKLTPVDYYIGLQNDPRKNYRIKL